MFKVHVLRLLISILREVMQLRIDTTGSDYAFVSQRSSIDKASNFIRAETRVLVQKRVEEELKEDL